MPDTATPNLPAIDMLATAAFWAKLGFVEAFRDEGWMILTRGALMVEFFPMPQLDPRESWFSACFRVDDLDALHAAFTPAFSGYPGPIPRIGEPTVEDSGLRIFYMVEINGSLIRCIAN